MKRIGILALILCFLFSALSVHAEKEEVYPDVCPLNVQYKVMYGNDGPLLHITAFNATKYPISYMEFSLRFMNAEMQPVPDANANYFRAYAKDMPLKPYTSVSYMFSAAAYPGAAYVDAFRMEKVIFSDGTEWNCPQGALYEQAFMYAENPVSEDGRYILQSGRTLKLVDYSYSSHVRTWYIWNDTDGWVPFSNDVSPSCTVWRSGVGIKLVINNNPALYTMQSYRVLPSPGEIAVKDYATAAVEVLTPVQTGYKKDDAAPTGTPGMHIRISQPAKDVPCNLGLWDYTGSDTRTWEIWSGTAWEPFSFDRGPTCSVWREGDIYLRLSYPHAYAVYALHIAQKEEQNTPKMQDAVTEPSTPMSSPAPTAAA